MLRIQREANDQVVLTISGQLHGDNLTALTQLIVSDEADRRHERDDKISGRPGKWLSFPAATRTRNRQNPLRRLPFLRRTLCYLESGTQLTIKRGNKTTFYLVMCPLLKSRIVGPARPTKAAGPKDH
jgi:hypothetical protein